MGKSELCTGLSRRVKKGFLKIAPYTKKEASDLARICLLRTLILCGTASFLVLLINFLLEERVSHISLSLCVIVTIILGRELPEHMVSRKYEAFQKEMLQYLSAVKARFIYSKSVLDAIDSAAYDFSPEVQKNASEIMKILLSGHRNKRVRDYIKNNGKDRYLKLFLIQAHETSENGDSITPQGESLFCKNIDILRTEVMKGIHERKKLKYMFSGYLFVAIFPVLMIPLVQKTGNMLSDELDIFYLGTGNFIVVLSYVALFAVYNVVSDFKGENMIDFGLSFREKAYYEVNPDSIRGKSAFVRDKINARQSKGLLWLDKVMDRAGQKGSRSMVVVKCLLCGITVFVMGVIFVALQQNAEKKALVSAVSNIDDIAVMSSETKKKFIEQGMLTVINEYKDSDAKGSLLETQVEERFSELVPDSSESVTASAVAEITERIEVYRGLYFHWYQTFALYVIATVAGLMPVFILVYKGYRRQEGIVTEVKRLQTVVIMERSLAGISTCELLESMEMFSDVFREDIQDALNLYQAGAENALAVLKEKGGKKSYEFKELAEDFMAISDVGVYDAFSSVEADRRGLEIMTELSEEIETSGKKNLMDVFSWIPGVIVMLGYLIIPFLRIALADLSDIFTMMDEIQVL